jgi:ammonia channel protein AmtB
MGVQILGGLVIALWAGTLSYFFFAIIKEQNCLRVSFLCEIIGRDLIQSGSSAYSVEKLKLKLTGKYTV